MIDVLVVSTAIYIQNTAKSCNYVFSGKQLNSFSSLFECGVNIAMDFLISDFPLQALYCAFEVPLFVLMLKWYSLPV